MALFDFYNYVFNGGFEAWLLDTSGDTAKMTPDYLEEIGSFQMAQVVRWALAEFGESGPSVDYGERSDQLGALPESAHQFFQHCDCAFDKLVDAMTHQLAVYASAHLKDVRAS